MRSALRWVIVSEDLVQKYDVNVQENRRLTICFTMYQFGIQAWRFLNEFVEENLNNQKLVFLVV